MKRLLMGLAPTLAAYAWRNRSKIRRWAADRRAGDVAAAHQPAAA